MRGRGGVPSPVVWVEEAATWDLSNWDSLPRGSPFGYSPADTLRIAIRQARLSAWAERVILSTDVNGEMYAAIRLARLYSSDQESGLRQDAGTVAKYAARALQRSRYPGFAGAYHGWRERLQGFDLAG